MIDGINSLIFSEVPGFCGHRKMADSRHQQQWWCSVLSTHRRLVSKHGCSGCTFQGEQCRAGRRCQQSSVHLPRSEQSQPRSSALGKRGNPIHPLEAKLRCRSGQHPRTRNRPRGDNWFAEHSCLEPFFGPASACLSECQIREPRSAGRPANRGSQLTDDVLLRNTQFCLPRW